MAVIGTALAACFLLQLHLVFVQAVNWDEYRFLADIHAHGRGELSAVLLTFQVHLFGWLTGLGDEIVQIRAARLFMLALEIGTAGLILAVSRRFFAAPAALFSALGYVSFSFVLQHGASFRFDPIVTFLLMLSVHFLVREHLRWAEMLALGFALALAVMVTVKLALALPLIIALALWRLAVADDRRDVLLRLSFAAVASIAILALLYQFHVTRLAGATVASSQAHLAASFDKTLNEVPFFPRFGYFQRSLTENLIHWTLLLAGTTMLAGAAITGRDRTRSLVLLAFLLPLLTILFYRNAFPYYYAFVLAPAALLFGMVAERPVLATRLWLPSAALLATATLHYWNALSVDAANQRRTVAAVHAVFPQPVPYLDRCSMISSYPQAGVFLSSWWIENYQSVSRPIMRETLAARQPVFLIVNSPFLADALPGSESERVPGLLEEDKAVLRSNFVHHWGPIWVAGKQAVASPLEQPLEVLIAGSYTLESARPVSIDGRMLAPGDAIRLDRGRHPLASAGGAQQIILRWGERLPRPAGTAPRELLFGRF